MLIALFRAYLLAFLLFCFIVVSFFFFKDIPLDETFLLLILLVCFPLIEKIFNQIQQDHSTAHNTLQWSNAYNHWEEEKSLLNIKVKNTLIILAVFIACHMCNISFINTHIILVSSIVFLLKIDKRVLFIFSLVCFALSIGWLLIEAKEITETLSISWYYFLIIGVLFEISSTLFQDSSETSKAENISKSGGNNSIQTYFQKFLARIQKWYEEKKISILKDIWEYDESEYLQKEDTSIQNNKTKKDKNSWEGISMLVKSEPGFIGKLFLYVCKKYYAHISNITLALYTACIFLVILDFKYNITWFLSIILYFFIVNYLASKYKWESFIHKKEPPYIPSFLQKKSNQEGTWFLQKQDEFFLQKSLLFSSIWTISTYWLMSYLSLWIEAKYYLWFFSIFFFTYMYNFSIFWKIIHTFCRKISQRITWFLLQIQWKITTVSFKNFIARNAYWLLSIFTIGCITIYMLIQSSFVQNLYQQYQESTQWHKTFIVHYTDEEKKQQEEDKRRKQEAAMQLEIKKKQALWEKLREESAKITSDEEKILPSEQITKKVSEIYTFSKWLQLWDNSQEVQNLEIIMKDTGYFTATPDQFFSQETKDSLIRLLITECGWPTTTQWILGLQARKCVYNLDITVPNQ